MNSDVNVAKSSSKKRKRTDGKAKKSVAAQKKKKDIGVCFKKIREGFGAKMTVSRIGATGAC